MNINKIISVLLLSHEMSITGAPVALQYMGRQLKNDGKFVAVLSPVNGPMVSEMLQDKIPVIIDSTIGGNSEWIKWASNFDLIVVNTVVPYHNIVQLEKTNLPVIWWIHDGEMSFRLGADRVLPRSLHDNIHVYAGGEYVYRVIKKYRPNYDVRNLLYCVSDYSYTLSPNYQLQIPNPKNRIIISNIGSIDIRKAQDVLVKAIRELPQEDIKKCLFVFVGKNNDNSIYQQIDRLREDYPDNTYIIPQVSRKEISDVYRQSTAVVCTSRDDPMPVFITESFMLGIPVICSSNTGTYDLITDGKNGFTFKSENINDLKTKLHFIINNHEYARDIGKEGRKLYENFFAPNAFREELYKIIQEI